MDECNETGASDFGKDFYDTFLQEFRFWIQRVLIPLVGTIGVIGNVITIIVLTRPKMRSSTNTYLTGLAIADMLYLIFVFTVSLAHYPGFHGPDYYYYWQYRRFGLWLVDATASVSTCLTVTFTVERYIAVCHPMRGKLLCTESRARIAILIVYLFCFLSTATTSFEWEVFTKVTVLQGNVTRECVGTRPTELGNDPTYQNVFYWYSTITFTFLPLILLSIFNSFLICAVHRSKKNRCKMTQMDHSSSSLKQENRITRTLIAVVLMFMICQIPSAILLILRSLHKIQNNSKKDKLFKVLGNIFNLLVTINACTNFILYCLLSAKFRRTFLATFFRKCYKLQPGTQSSVATQNFTYAKASLRSSRDKYSPYSSSFSRGSFGQRPRNGNVRLQQSSSDDAGVSLT